MRYFASLLLVVSFSLPYVLDFQGKFLFASVGVLAALYLTVQSRTMTVAGLKCSPKHLAISVLILAIVFLFSNWLINTHTERLGLTVLPYEGIEWRLSPVFQVLNEEIVTRALLLGFLIRFFRQQWIVSAAAAAAFTGLHYLLYRFSLHAQVDLLPLTLFNLFLFGLLCNSLFLTWRHIWLGYAIHLGWNLNRFTKDFLMSGTPAREGMTFNFFEGSIWLTAVLLVGLFAVLGFSPKSSVQASPDSG